MSNAFHMSSISGQALIEAVVVIPLLIVCAAGMVDVGIVARDRIAISHAATVAAVAAGDIDVAASLPASLQHVRIHRTASAVEISGQSSPAIFARFGGVRVSSRVALLPPQDGEA